MSGDLQFLSFDERRIEGVYADACGNTFVIFDCLSYPFTSEEWESVKEKVWEILQKTKVDDALVLRNVNQDGDRVRLKMHVLEPDRTEADFCGNGARAVGFYLHHKYGAIHKDFVLVSRQGEHGFKYDSDFGSVEMGTPILFSEAFIFRFEQKNYKFRFVDCVEPHLVSSDFFDAKLLSQMGEQINSQRKDLFPRGVNVNCYRYLHSNRIEVLTYERGVYAITKACGTGSLACTKAALDKKLIVSDSTVTIQVLGGELKIDQCNHVFWLGGPVKLPR